MSTPPTPNRRRAILAGLALVAAVAFVQVRAHRDEWAINRRLSRLCRLVEKAPDEGPLMTAARAREISLFFTRDLDLDFGAPLPSLRTRDEVAAAAHHARSSADSIEVKLRDRELSLDAARTSATMRLTAEAAVTAHGQVDRDIREFRLNWIKQDGEWLLQGLGADDSIRRPASLPPGYF
jgi:hypothetical protein